MSRVVPSQVVELIDQLFPPTRTAGRFDVHMGGAGHLAAILAFAKEVPPELLTLAGQDLADYVVSVALIETVLHLWTSAGSHWKLTDYRATNPVVLLRRALEKCPDEAPSPATAQLLFITDTDLRESVRRDISAADQDFVNGEWKGATVLAGSATEALLLWAIQEADRSMPGAVGAATATLVRVGTLSQKPDSIPERWNLIELIEVAHELKLIVLTTVQQARLGKNFRNLIHPGRAARLGEVCDRATALSARAAVAHVVRDLTP
jgi:hypothetical protein